MELRKINYEDVYAQWEYTTSLPEDENGLTNPYHGVSYEEYYEKVFPELIGEFRIRHHLTEALKNGLRCHN